jgi:transcriptional regulator GlxA family with amidase domain
MLEMRMTVMDDLSEKSETQAATPTRTPLKLRTVLAEIAEHACEPGFSAMSIAEKYGVTEREVRRLLKKTGKSFSDHKMRRRLERARALLVDPTAAHLAVPDIALRVGFSDPESFDANYRRRFGVAPKAAREGKGA